MRPRLAEEVEALAREVASEYVRSAVPPSADIRALAVESATEYARSAVPGFATSAARRLVDERIRSLPDPAAVAGAAVESGIRTSTDLRLIARKQAEEVLRNGIRHLPSMADVDSKIRNSADVKRLAHDEAVTAAATETKRLLDAEYEAVLRDLVEEVARTSIEQVVRGHAAREIAAGALPRLIEVSVDGSGPRTVDGDTHHVLPDVLLALGAGCHVLLVGPAGTGKSTMAKQTAQALDLGFHAMSVGPTTPTSKMFGYLDAHGTYHRTPLRDAYERGGLMLLDELDNGHPGLLAELNQALSLDVCAFPDGMVERHERFRLVATANTYGHGGERQYVGRQALDAATLDRLLVVDVPVDDDMERRVTLAQAPNAEDAAREFLAQVRRLREAASDKKLPVIFSPRASIHAARLLESGADPAKVRQWCLVRGLSDAHRSALGMKDAS